MGFMAMNALVLVLVLDLVLVLVHSFAVSDVPLELKFKGKCDRLSCWNDCYLHLM